MRSGGGLVVDEGAERVREAAEDRGVATWTDLVRRVVDAG